ELRSSINLWIDRARLRDCGGSVARVCGVILARMKSHASLVEWVWPSFPLLAAFYRGAKRENKKSAADCWPTSADDLPCNDLTNYNLMSRIGNKAVEIPDKVKVNVGDGGQVSVEGPKGKMQWTLPREIRASVQDNRVSLVREAETRSVKALHGLSRSLVHNMIRGVSE